MGPVTMPNIWGAKGAITGHSMAQCIIGVINAYSGVMQTRFLNTSKEYRHLYDNVAHVQLDPEACGNTIPEPTTDPARIHGYQDLTVWNNTFLKCLCDVGWKTTLKIAVLQNSIQSSQNVYRLWILLFMNSSSRHQINVFSILSSCHYCHSLYCHQLSCSLYTFPLIPISNICTECHYRYYNSGTDIISAENLFFTLLISSFSGIFTQSCKGEESWKENFSCSFSNVLLVFSVSCCVWFQHYYDLFLWGINIYCHPFRLWLLLCESFLWRLSYNNGF